MRAWHFVPSLALFLLVHGSPAGKTTPTTSSAHAQTTKASVQHPSDLPQLPAAVPYPPKLVASPDTLAMPPPASVQCQLQTNLDARHTPERPTGFGQIEFTITGLNWGGARDQISSNLEKKFLPPNNDPHCQLITTPNSWTFAWDPILTYKFVAKGAFPLDEKPGPPGEPPPADIRLSAACVEAALQAILGRRLTKNEECQIVRVSV